MCSELAAFKDSEDVNHLYISISPRHRAGYLRLWLSPFASPQPIDGDGAGAGEDQRESDGGAGHREFKSAVAGEQSVRQMHFQDCDEHIHEDCERGQPGEKTDKNQDAAAELGHNHEIGHEGRQAHLMHDAGDHVHVVGNLLPTVGDHDGAESQSQDEQCQGLQAVQEVQSVLHVAETLNPNLWVFGATKCRSH